jgi:hypothetical protein
MGRYALRVDQENEPTTGDTSGFTIEQISLIESYSNNHTLKETEMLKQLMLSGYTYDESVKKVHDGDVTVPGNMENFPWIKNDLDK